MANDDKKKTTLGERVFGGLVAISIWEMGKLMYRSRREEGLADEYQDKIDEIDDEQDE